MEREEYDIMYRVEDSHWWYQGMAAITIGVLDRFVGRDRSLQVLDAGCGTGASMQYLKAYGEVTGIDISRAALGFCQRRGAARMIEGSIAALPFRDSAFDLLTSFDVLSAFDAAGGDRALSEFHRVLKAGGHVLLRLPAYEWLRARHDACVHTAHRFTRTELRRRLRAAGFEIVHSSYANTTLFPLVAAKRMSERLVPLRQTGSDLTIATRGSNGLFRRILRAEAPLIRRFGLPFGLTVLALGRKTAPSG